MKISESYNMDITRKWRNYITINFIILNSSLRSVGVNESRIMGSACKHARGKKKFMQRFYCKNLRGMILND
jgi:hypothetical protein